MQAVRRAEQRGAAQLGRYNLMIQLGHPSSDVKTPSARGVFTDLLTIFSGCLPECVYLHQPADKHDTHIGVTIAALQAMRRLPPGHRPARVIGCEVWRALDWLPDEHKVLMDVSGRDNLAAALNGVFDSQIAGGKRYDLATFGRRAANATFFNSHATDASTQLVFGMDLTPLVTEDTLDITGYVCDFIDRFQQDVRLKLEQRTGKA